MTRERLVAWGLVEAESPAEKFRCEIIEYVDPDMPMPIPSPVLLGGPETFRAVFYPIGSTPVLVLCERDGPLVTLLSGSTPLGVTRVDMGYLYRCDDLDHLTRNA